MFLRRLPARTLVRAAVARPSTCARARSSSTEAAAEMPAAAAMRQVFAHAAVPMVGFGFMDNLVMIQAGDLIDNTIGVHFGLATLAAAACGQIFSDVSGVAFGGVVEDACARLGFQAPNITAAQRALPRVKAVGVAGAITGVVFGCCLGMVSLLFMDLDAAERQKRDKELDAVFARVIREGSGTLRAARSSLFLVDGDEAWTRVAEGVAKEIRVPLSKASLVAACVRDGVAVNVADAYRDARFDRSVDDGSGFRTRSVLCVPVFSVCDEGETPKVVGAVQFLNNAHGVFSEHDERAAKMLASHVAIFLDDVLE